MQASRAGGEAAVRLAEAGGTGARGLGAGTGEHDGVPEIIHHGGKRGVAGGVPGVAGAGAAGSSGDGREGGAGADDFGKRVGERG